ncbi:hypothetical protein [Martelella sp. HB161492]|uniref:hypothetical protein n=1 Tax=Martelella sp. HB161492 TaxID=2720726 RepID=UPI0015914525|nr:hypothetical protein [Martelella sp. HB161492]
MTQGTVFSCAKSIRYSKCDVFGLTITARCDVAQDKYPVLNYLPVVKLQDWLRRDGLDILVSQERNEQNGRLRSILKSADVSDALIGSIPLSDIAEIHFPIKEGEKTKNKISEQFRDHIVSMKEFEELNEKNDFNLIYTWFRDKKPKSIETLIKRLIRHEVLGYYILESLSIDDTREIGFVCLLREVQTLPRSISTQLGKGIDHETYHDLCENISLAFNLDIPRGEMAMPIVEVYSPTIEHILQAFSHLFGRIGVADPRPESVSAFLSDSLKNNRGGQEE